MPRSNKSSYRPHKLSPHKTINRHLSVAKRLNFEAIGTLWQIDIRNRLTDDLLTRIKALIIFRTIEFDKQYSRFRKDSLVTRMSQQSGTYNLPDDARPLLDFYKSLYGLTAGTMTPLIGQPLSDAGYDAEYSLQAGIIKRPPEWDDILDYRYPQLHVKQPALLDFGAAGKGYLVDLVAELLIANNIDDFTVDAGGDMIHRSPSDLPEQIGLEHPDNPEQIIGLASINNIGLCGSAGNRRTWQGYNHILNPYTLKSPHHIKAVWTTAESGIVADGLATALYFVSPNTLVQQFSFDYAIMFSDNSLESSANFPAIFYQ